MESRDFLKTAGRALMSWWNQHGPALPAPGERYRAWWRSTYDALDGDLWGPSDVLEQLQLYRDEAELWWDNAGQPGPEPPEFSKRKVGDVVSEVSSPAVGGTALILVGVIVLALIWRNR